MKRIFAQFGIAVALLGLFCWTAAAGDRTVGQATINYIEALPADDRPVNQVRAYFTVTSPGGRPIGDLDASAFTVVEDGQPVTLDAVHRAEDPMAVVLVIDTSGSMLARDKSGLTSMAAVKAAAAEFVGQLGTEDRVAIYTFNNSPHLALDFSTDRQLALTMIQRIEAKQNAGTCLYGAAWSAVKKCAEIPRGRRAILLFTDGRDEKGDPEWRRYSVNDVIDAATTQTIRVPIYTIGAGPRVDLAELDRLAAFTGGRHMSATSMEPLAGFFRAIAEQLKQQYVLRYSTQAPSGEHSLVVKVSRGADLVQDEKRFWSPPLPLFPPPRVVFQQPSSDARLKPGTVAVRLGITPAQNAVKVRYYVDGVLAAEKTGDDLDRFEWQARAVADGLHVLRAEVIDSRQQSAMAEVTVRLQHPMPVVTPAETTSAVTAAPLAIGAGIAALFGLVVLLICRRRRPNACPSPPVEPAAAVDREDETLILPDDGADAVVPAARLTVVESLCLAPNSEFRFIGTVRMGRNDRNEVHIPDKPVSRRHAEIYFENNAYRIRDLGSRNGVKIDGRRIAPEGERLVDGLRIQLGPKTVLQFHCPEMVTAIQPDEKTRRYGQ